MTPCSRWPDVVADLMRKNNVSERGLSNRSHIARTTLRRFLRREGRSLGIYQLDAILGVFGLELEALLMDRGAN